MQASLSPTMLLRSAIVITPFNSSILAVSIYQGVEGEDDLGKKVRLKPTKAQEFVMWKSVVPQEGL